MPKMEWTKEHLICGSSRQDPSDSGVHVLQIPLHTSMDARQVITDRIMGEREHVAEACDRIWVANVPIYKTGQRSSFFQMSFESSLSIKNAESMRFQIQRCIASHHGRPFMEHSHSENCVGVKS